MEVELEAQVLESIYGEDFERTPDGFSIRVLPSFGGAFKNHVALQLSAKLPDGYPDNPIQIFDLQVIEGELHPLVLQHLQDLLFFESQKLRGEAAMFALIEKLKERLELYNEDISEGLFVWTTNEIILQIFGYLDIFDLGRLACVIKKFKKLSEDNDLWIRLAAQRNVLIPSSVKDEPIGTAKNIFLKKVGLWIPTMKWVGIIADRKRTGDEWDKGPQGPWRERIVSELRRTFTIPFKIGPIFDTASGKRVGYFRFSNIEDASRKYWESPWVLDSLMNFPTTPYSSHPVGFIEFTSLDDYFDMDIMRSMAEVVRGMIFHLRRPEGVPCLTEGKEMISRFVPHSVGLQDFPWIVNPKGIRQPVKYLNDIVDALNAALLPLSKLKSNQRYARKFVPYAKGQLLYPFSLDYDALGWEVDTFGEGFSHTYVQVWKINIDKLFALL